MVNNVLDVFDRDGLQKIQGYDDQYLSLGTFAQDWASKVMAMGGVLKSLEDLWAKGQLRDLEHDLDRFIRDNLGEIRRVMAEGRGSGTEIARRRYNRGEINNQQLVDFCVRAVLRKRGTCNPRRDIQDQCSEIEREVWYEGERAKTPVGAERREEIARSWASQHASKWREWRLFQLLYVWEKKADLYVPILTAEVTPQHKS